MGVNFKDKKFISYALFEDAVEHLTLGELNNCAVSRLIGADHATLSQVLRGNHKWQADVWLYYMVALGAIKYEAGLLTMKLHVPTSYLQKKLSKISAADRQMIFCKRRLRPSEKLEKLKVKRVRKKQNPKELPTGFDEGDVQY